LYNAFLQGGVDPASPAGYIQDALNNLAQDKKWAADPFNLEIIAYEGGPGLISSDPATGTLYKNFSADPRMQTIYDTFLNQWKAAGYLHVFHHYNDVMAPAPQYGLWGALYNIMQTTSPKYNALIAFLSANLCWWTGCSVTPTSQNPPVVGPFGPFDYRPGVPTGTPAGAPPLGEQPSGGMPATPVGLATSSNSRIPSATQSIGPPPSPRAASSSISALSSVGTSFGEGSTLASGGLAMGGLPSVAASGVVSSANRESQASNWNSNPVVPAVPNGTRGSSQGGSSMASVYQAGPVANATQAAVPGNPIEKQTSLFPRVVITAPVEGHKFENSESITIMVSVEGRSSIRSIVIDGDRAVLGTCGNKSSCSVAWPGKGIKQGTHTIAATAVDTLGHISRSTVTIVYLVTDRRR